MAKAKPKATGKDSPILELRYELGELPSSQHRAGLAGLVFMVQWLREQNLKKPGLCEIDDLGAHGLTLRLDERGLEQLFDQVYGATNEEQASATLWKGQEPLRVGEVTTETTKVVGGKPKTTKKTKTVYYYPVVVPRGAFLASWDPSADGKGRGRWVKLWRDMVWAILRGVPAQRRPFEARAAKEQSSDARDTWAGFKDPAATVPLPSTYYLGAQATTAEDVQFRDRARFQFLLHFAPFVAQTYVPEKIDNDGKHVPNGYAIAVPDVADLRQFTEELPAALATRDSEIRGFRPQGCLIDLSAEAGLDLFVSLKRRLEEREGAQRTSDLVLGVDVFHMAKEGNNIRVLGTGRIDPDEDLIDEYRQLRGQMWSPHFRLQRMKNLIAGRSWHADFDRLCATESWHQTIGSNAFRHDARITFERMMMTNDETNETLTDRNAPTLESVLYKMVGMYLAKKMKSKHDMDYQKAEAAGEKEEFGKAREKLARDAFLGIRSRTGPDFVDYFTATICSAPQHIRADEYALVARALLTPESIATVRTLTMLALSARS